MVQEVVVYRVLVQEVPAAVRAGLAHCLALEAHVADEVIILVVVLLFIWVLTLSTKTRHVQLLTLFCQAIVFLAFEFEVLNLVLKENRELES